MRITSLRASRCNSPCHDHYYHNTALVAILYVQVILVLFLAGIFTYGNASITEVTTIECKINVSPFATLGGCCTYSMYVVPDPASIKAQVGKSPQEVQEIDEEDGLEIELDLDIDDPDEMYVF